MGDKKGTEFNFKVTYSVEGGTPTVTATSMYPTDVDDDTSIDDEGNINLDKDDTAYVEFDCDTEGWAISALQIEGKKGWGKALGNKAQKNFPLADAETGNVPPDPDGNFMLHDMNKKSNTIEYRVQVKNSDGTTVWADPRVRSVGR